jgi:hypothetical protein
MRATPFNVIRWEARAMRISHAIPASTRLLVALCIAMAGVANAAAQDQAPPPSRTAEETKTMPPKPATGYRHLDTDSDGRLSATEAGRDSAFNAAFNDMDTDADGYVSNNEYGEFAYKSEPTGSAGSFAGLDKDKDGRVSSTEAGADATFDSGFAAMDGNGDGFVTDAEYQAHAQGKKEPAPPP